MASPTIVCILTRLQLRISLVAIIVSVTTSISCRGPTHWRYEYGMHAHKTRPLRWLEVVAGGHSGGLSIKVTNTSSATVRLLWTHSAIVGVGGRSDGVLLSGQRLIEAGAPAAASVVPAGAYFEGSIFPAQSVSWRDGQISSNLFGGASHSPGGWTLSSILPAGPYHEKDPGELEQGIARLGGKRLRLLLAAEHRHQIYAFEMEFSIERIQRYKCSYGGIAMTSIRCEPAGVVYPPEASAGAIPR